MVYVLGLLEKEKPLLGLEDASLDHADLTELRLREAHLRGSDLRRSDLQGADLHGTDLSNADLRGANLTNADLSHVNLSGANLLPYDEHQPTRLSHHNLKDHALPTDEVLRSLAEQREEQRRQRLGPWYAVPWYVVTYSNLTDTKLAGANLTGAILANADLRDVRGLTQDQVDSAIGNRETKLPDAPVLKSGGVWEPLKSPKTWSDEIAIQIRNTELQSAGGAPHEGATMPNGQQYEDWLKNKEDRGEEGENSGPS